MKKLCFSIATVVLFLSACSKSNNTGGTTVTPPIVAPDTTLQITLPFPIGASVSISLLQNNTKYSNLAKKEYNSLTAENAMKFAGLHPSQNTYTWTDADYFVNFAQANNKRIHGHTLLWHQSLPSWVTNFVGDSTAWENLMKAHIQTVVAHFKGKVASWDVVNEAFEDNGSLRNSIWRQKLGNDYVARCFQYAYQADTSVLLFYNDYGHEYSSTKRAAIINMLNTFKSRGVPVHGIGLQFHTNYTQSDANIAAAITAAAGTGLKVHISELDVALNAGNNPALTLTASLAEQQATKYKFIFKIYNAIPAAQKFGITTWNIGDADSWIPRQYNRPDWPLPFDGNYLRKPAYYGILDGIK
ncbi:MAG: endo-1,4-beta-xylanase [Segetibacter sp.]|nr:endo-1,4-beta-xylanase [Segetibacter sp.]